MRERERMQKCQTLKRGQPVISYLIANRIVHVQCMHFVFDAPSGWLGERHFLFGNDLSTLYNLQGWGMYSTLLIDLFKFLDPFLRNTELATPVMMLYKGTLKVLLVLLHDFPEFLCDYHYGFCDEIPPNCIQMRNLILSAFPRNMRLPDPFTPNLKVDLLAEITLPPRAVINYTTIIPASPFKKDLDAYLKARAPVTFLSELRSHMQV